MLSLCTLMYWKGLGICLEPQFSLCKTEAALPGGDERADAGKVPCMLDAPSKCQRFFLALQGTSSDASAPIWKLVPVLWLSFLGVLCPPRAASSNHRLARELVAVKELLPAASQGFTAVEKLEKCMSFSLRGTAVGWSSRTRLRRAVLME